MNLTIMATANGITESDLPRLMLNNASNLRKYISSKIPTRLQSVLASDDVIQEVWTSAFKARAEFTENGPDSFDRWLTTLADRRIIDGIRRAETEKRGGKLQIRHIGSHASSIYDLFANLQSPCRTPSSEMGVREAHSAIMIALSSLSDNYRQAITLMHFEGKSRVEIASIMQSTPEAVNDILYRGMRQLRNRLSGPGGFFSSISPKGNKTINKNNGRQQ